uniref:Origin recognition complex subunit 5 n=1 Tax=Schistocephalus solidus TaxID=70667 RepID=A0A0X3QBW2_SCHSO
MGSVALRPTHTQTLPVYHLPASGAFACYPTGWSCDLCRYDCCPKFQRTRTALLRAFPPRRCLHCLLQPQVSRQAFSREEHWKAHLSCKETNKEDGKCEHSHARPPVLPT